MNRFVLALLAVVTISGVVMQGPGDAEAFVYACGPIAFPNNNGGPFSMLTVYNASLVANVTVKFLNKFGTNLVGSTIEGQAVHYPGDIGSNTSPVAPGNTRILQWL